VNPPKKPTRWVIKIGSSLVTNEGQGLNLHGLDQWVTQIAQLFQQGNFECVIVSSGAVAEGLNRLGWQNRPRQLHELQAAAAIGQMGLIQAYEVRFQEHSIKSAQILLTHDDLSHRQRYLNARSTLKTLLSHKVIPIVNENDTVAFEEIKFGDNDTLAALVTNLIEADQLIILTDQPGMYTKDPRQHSDAKLINTAQAGDPELEKMAGLGTPGKLGRGGMITKVRAANRAANSGAITIIAPGKKDNVLIDIANNHELGTRIYPAHEPIAARKQWLAGHLQVKGSLVIDSGAVNALRHSGKSLLAIGVKKTAGQFQRGEVVSCVDRDNNEIARGLINYHWEETGQIIGKPSAEIEGILGYIDEPELIHRDNLVIMSLKN